MVREHHDWLTGLQQVADEFGCRLDLAHASLFHNFGQPLKGHQGVWIGHQGIGIKLLLTLVHGQVKGHQAHLWLLVVHEDVFLLPAQDMGPHQRFEFRYVGRTRNIQTAPRGIPCLGIPIDKVKPAAPVNAQAMQDWPKLCRPVWHDRAGQCIDPVDLFHHQHGRLGADGLVVFEPVALVKHHSFNSCKSRNTGKNVVVHYGHASGDNLTGLLLAIDNPHRYGRVELIECRLPDSFDNGRANHNDWQVLQCGSGGS